MFYQVWATRLHSLCQSSIRVVCVSSSLSSFSCSGSVLLFPLFRVVYVDSHLQLITTDQIFGSKLEHSTLKEGDGIKNSRHFFRRFSTHETIYGFCLQRIINASITLTGNQEIKNSRMNERDTRARTNESLSFQRTEKFFGLKTSHHCVDVQHIK